MESERRALYKDPILLKQEVKERKKPRGRMGMEGSDVRVRVKEILESGLSEIAQNLSN